MGAHTYSSAGLPPQPQPASQILAETAAAVALKLKHPLSFPGVVVVQELENVRSACHNLTNLKAELLTQTQGDMVPCARCVVQMKGATEMFEVDSVDSP